MDPDSRLANEAARNLDSRGLWDGFAAHRRRVTDLLFGAAPGANAPSPGWPRLCVLGAGNSNDLDLKRLRAVFGTIELIDWDASALQHGIAAQGLAADSGVVLTGGVDLLGVDLAPAEPLAIPIILPNRVTADVVASVCLLSQLLEQVASELGTSSPRYLAAVQAVRRRHLQALIELSRPGGTAILVTDVTSSTTAPELLNVDQEQLPGLLTRLLTQRNFFTGLNPPVLLEVLKSDRMLAPQIDEIRPIPPWLWPFNQRVYAVYGIQFRRIVPKAS